MRSKLLIISQVLDIPFTELDTLYEQSRGEVRFMAEKIFPLDTVFDDEMLKLVKQIGDFLGRAPTAAEVLTFRDLRGMKNP